MLTLQFTPFPNLATKRLLLRQLKIEDDKAILAIRSNADVNKYLDRRPATSIEEARNFIKNINSSIANNESVYWAITLKDDATLIGTICYWNISRENDTAEIGYELHPDFHGRGIMQEAITAVLNYAFAEMKVERIEAFTHVKNGKSSSLLQKNNFKRDFKLEEHLRKTEPFDDLVIYVLQTD